MLPRPPPVYVYIVMKNSKRAENGRKLVAQFFSFSVHSLGIYQLFEISKSHPQLQSLHNTLAFTKYYSVNNKFTQNAGYQTWKFIFENHCSLFVRPPIRRIHNTQ
jgi:hypothetical protein